MKRLLKLLSWFLVAEAGTMVLNEPTIGKCSQFTIEPNAAINRDATGCYCACRWNYREVPKLLRQCIVEVTNVGTGKIVICTSADWGPAWRLKRRIIDLSPIAMTRINAETDKTDVRVTLLLEPK